MVFFAAIKLFYVANMPFFLFVSFFSHSLLYKLRNCKISSTLSDINSLLSEASNDDGYVSRRRSRRSLDVDGDDLPLDNAALQELLEELIRHKDAWAFTRPVLKSEVCVRLMLLLCLFYVRYFTIQVERQSHFQ